MTTYAVSLCDKTTGREFEKEGISDRETAIDLLKLDPYAYGVVYECVAGKQERAIAARPFELARKYA